MNKRDCGGWLAAATLALFLLLFPLVALAQSDEGRIEAEAYWELIARTREEAQARQTALQMTPLSDAAATFATISTVVLNDGTAVPVDHSVLADQLRTDPPDWEVVITQLGTMLSERENWPGVRYDAAAAAQARADLDEILADLDTEPITDEELAEIERQLQDGEWGPEAGEPADLPQPISITIPNVATILLATVGGLILLAVLAFAFRRLARDFAADADLPPEVEDADENLTAQTALARAQTFSRQQDYRTAVRYLYLSTLLILEEKGLLRYNRTRTNREYIRSVADKPEMARVLGDVVEVFDRVWYGYEEIDDTEYSSYQTQVEKLRQQRK